MGEQAKRAVASDKPTERDLDTIRRWTKSRKDCVWVGIETILVKDWVNFQLDSLDKLGNIQIPMSYCKAQGEREILHGHYHEWNL